MGDNSVFSVFSNIWSSVRLKIPSIPSFFATQIAYTTYFDGNFFCRKRYFNDILWAQAYNNNTLLLAA
jgi:uncharacterized membrane protein YoaT (DUF817 family)